MKIIVDCPEGWYLLILALEHPELVVGHPGVDSNVMLEALNANGLLPLSYHRWHASGVVASFRPEFSQGLEKRMTLYRAFWAATWHEVDRILGKIVDVGLHPIVLKGAHLGMRYYEPAHLRPLSDLDVAFPDLGEAEAAYQLLLQKGFRYGGQNIGGDVWALSHHMPTLEDSATGLHVEVHGSLVYAPLDRRWIDGADQLLHSRESFEHNGLNLEGLSPEANVVYLCAHMFLQHEHEPPIARVLYDLQAVLKASEGNFSWERVLQLSRAGGFGAPVARGLRLLQALLDFSVPESALASLSRGENSSVPLSCEATASQKVVEQVANTKGVWGPLRLAFRYACPRGQFMRFRYPERAHLPLVFLYCYRWWIQAGKVFRLLYEKMRRKLVL